MTALFLPGRTPRIETGPVVLGLRRLYVLPTRIGLLYAALLFGLFLGSLNYGLSLGYLFAFLLTGMAVASLIHTVRNLAGLILSPQPVRSVFAGEPAAFSLRIENPSARTRYALRLRAAGEVSPPIDIAAGDSGELRLLFSPPGRGFHRPGRLTLYSTWPLGLFRCWNTFEFDWGVLVYPRPANDAQPWPTAASEGRSEGVMHTEEAEFSGLRNYHPGDSLRRIAWKTAARGQGLFSKAFASARNAEIWLDWDAALEQDVEARLSRLTRWALDAEAAGYAWGMRLPGVRLPIGRGEAHLRQGLEHLARYGL